jgi:hypothetical protein
MNIGNPDKFRELIVAPLEPVIPESIPVPSPAPSAPAPATPTPAPEKETVPA